MVIPLLYNCKNEAILKILNIMILLDFEYTFKNLKIFLILNIILKIVLSKF
jgi:hypothetical protein